MMSGAGSGSQSIGGERAYTSVGRGRKTLFLWNWDRQSVIHHFWTPQLGSVYLLDNEMQKMVSEEGLPFNTTMTTIARNLVDGQIAGMKEQQTTHDIPPGLDFQYEYHRVYPAGYVSPHRPFVELHGKHKSPLNVSG